MRLLLALAVLVLGLLLEMHTCAFPVPIIDRAAISIEAVHHGTMPLPASTESGSLGETNSEITVFRVDQDEKLATRVPVRFGFIASGLIEIKDGLQEGDKVIISDMSRFENVDRVRIE
jgi:multidrug efflux pump subunit AcrA (membrane-fusion protein)